MSSNNQKMAKDTIIYMIAKSIEGLIGILTISIMSHIYVPSEMGRYSTINIAITTIAMVCIQWLTQSVFRYMHKYQKEDDKKKFYSTIFVSWIKVNSIVLSIGIIGFSIFNSYIKDILDINLIIASLIMFVTYNTYQLVISILAGMGKSVINLKLSIFNVFSKLFAIVVFNYILGSQILWIFISYIIADFLTAVFGIYNMKIKGYVNYKDFDKDIQSKFTAYGVPLIGNMLATSVLNKLDIYIINFSLGEESAGIYQTNYSIIASAFILIATGAMRGSYPTILKLWNQGDSDGTKKLLKVAIRNYMLISLPAVVGVFSISDGISQVLFKSLYWEGHFVMGFVALGMMFLGLTEYAIKPWELQSKTKEIVKRSMFCGFVNIVLNLMFIKTFGYIFGGISTAISFATYFVIAVFGTRKDILFQVDFKTLFKILFSSLVMGIVIISIKGFITYNLITLSLMVILGVVVYILILFLTGEIKNEVEFLKSKLKK